jgi:23S rRNA (uracil1939-C5)-methyltransferase
LFAAMHAHAIEPSELSCEHSERCGGCAFMGTPVAVQLTRKRAQVRSALDAYPALAALAVGEVAPAATMLGYRTRAKLVATADGALGLFARGGHEVVDIPGCRVLHPLLLQVAAEVRARLQSQPGLLSGVDLRLVTGESEPAVLLTVNGDARRRPQLQAFAERLSSVTGVLGVALRAHAQGAIQQLDGIPEPVSGVAMARDALRPGGLFHYASHGSFVQVHREQAAALSARLIARLATALGGLRGRRILELYAGSGALALALCAEGAHVLCVERYAPALEHALRAQREQNLQGLAAKSGDAEYVLDQLAAQGARFDALVVNPPRRGLSAGVRARIAELAPAAVVYVSCEPSTLARDLSDLAQRGLAADGVEPFDMMPLAADVESLTLLRPAAPTRIAVLHEDAQLLVVDKPPYLPTIPEGEHASSLLARLRDEHGLPELSAVHRLDAGTSGVCIFAKTRADVSELAARLAAGQKQYLALVRGNLHLKGTVRAPLREAGKTRQATTRYSRAERVGGHALVRVRPEQGRTHQVRKHMAALGHPVLGDARYGDAASNRFFEHKHGLQRPFLHAWRIAWPAVDGKAPLAFEAALAADLSVVLASLRGAQGEGDRET